MERQYNLESEELLILAQENFGVDNNRISEKKSLFRINNKQLEPGERIINIKGKRMRAVDLGSKGLRGIFESAIYRRGHKSDRRSRQV